MTTRVVRIVMVAALGLIGLGGCSLFPRLGDGAADGQANFSANVDTTGSIAAPPSEPAPRAEKTADAFIGPLGIAY